MSKGINLVILVGNVGKDPEVKYMPNGTAVVNLSLATSEQWKDKQTGDKQERTEWNKVAFFGKLAEIVGEYVRKGSQLYVRGKLRTRTYEKDGQKHYVTEIIAEDMQMLGGRQGEAKPPVTPATGGDFQDDSEIPF